MTTTDEFDLAGEHTAGHSTPPPPRPRRSRARAAPWVAGAVALVVVGALAAPSVPLVVGRGDGPEVGFSDLPLTEPPTVAWQTELAYLSSMDLTETNVVATIPATEEPSQTVVAVDLATGAESWRHQDDDGTCQLREVVVCVTAPGTDDAMLVTLTDDGDRQERRHPGALIALPSGEDLVVAERTDADPLEDIVLVEPDGNQRWRVEADAVEGAPDAIWPSFYVDDDNVILFATAEKIDLQSGAVTPQTDDDFGLPWTIATDEGVVELEADELPLSIDDDVGGPVRLHQSETGEISAMLRGDDEELWRLERTECHPQIRATGTIVLTCWGQNGVHSILAIDEVTGQTSWERPGTGWPLAASDGVILTTTDEPSQLVALDPADGSELWHLPLDGMTYANAFPLDDGLLILSETTLTRLTW